MQVETLGALRTLVLEAPASQKEAADMGAVMGLVQTLFCFADGVSKPRAYLKGPALSLIAPRVSLPLMGPLARVPARCAAGVESRPSLRRPHFARS